MANKKDFFSLLPFEIKDDVDEIVLDLQEQFHTRSETSTQIGFTLLKLQESNLWSTKGNYKNFNQFVEQTFNISGSTANRTMKNCRRYKELGLDAKNVGDIRMSDFGRALKLIDKNIVTEEEFVNDWLPRMTEGHEKCLSSVALEKQVNAHVKQDDKDKVKPKTVNFGSEEALQFYSNMDAVRSNEQFSGMSDQKILNLALGNFSYKIATEEGIGFIQTMHMLNVTTSLMPPGMCVVPIVYDKEKFDEALSRLAEELPDNKKDDLAYQLEVRNFIKNIKDSTVKAYMGEDDSVILSAEEREEAKLSIVVDEEELPENIHTAYLPEELLKMEKEFNSGKPKNQTKKSKQECADKKKRVAEEKKAQEEEVDRLKKESEDNPVKDFVKDGGLDKKTKGRKKGAAKKKEKANKVNKKPIDGHFQPGVSVADVMKALGVYGRTLQKKAKAIPDELKKNIAAAKTKFKIELQSSPNLATDDQLRAANFIWSLWENKYGI